MLVVMGISLAKLLKKIIRSFSIHPTFKKGLSNCWKLERIRIVNRAEETLPKHEAGDTGYYAAIFFSLQCVKLIKWVILIWILSTLQCAIDKWLYKIANSLFIIFTQCSWILKKTTSNQKSSNVCCRIYFIDLEN